jgi:cytochrome c oxidase assembly protein subunit 11
MTVANAKDRPNHRKLVVRLLLLVAAAFAFGFALVPLYNVLCQVTGLNGRTKDGIGAGGMVNSKPASRIDTSRVVTVEFTETVMPGLPWEIKPLTRSLDLHPGELHQVTYLVRNLSDKPIVGQAVPSVTPGQAAQHFDKLDCFCFRQQTLAPGEAREMPLTFVVKPEIDTDIRTVTLSYAFFSAPGQGAEAKQEGSK